MPTCSYVVFAREGARDLVAEKLAALKGCEVVPAENGDVLILLTTTPGIDGDEALRREVEAIDEIECTVLSFGEIDPGAIPADPGARWRRRGELRLVQVEEDR